MVPAQRIGHQAAVQRLAALAPLDRRALNALDMAIGQSVQVRPRRDIQTEGSEIQGPRLIVSGWAARVRHLSDGRRQFLSFLLPGDLIGLQRQPEPLAVCNITTVTNLVTCAVPPASESPTLDRAYAMSKALEEAYLLEHIARLGRLSAQERICSLLLEFEERLQLAGLVQDGAFDMPLTQEILADALGLTSVHVNRMLQLARASGDITLKSGRARIRDTQDLARKVGRTPVRVSGSR